MRFFYHMKGRDIGSLLVRRRTSYYANGLSKPLYNVTGQQGDFWYKAEINIPDRNNDYQLVIEGTRGASYQGDIAIDDVSLSPGCQLCKGCNIPGLYFNFVVVVIVVVAVGVVVVVVQE